MKLYTIGFSKKNAKHFFELIKKNNIKKVIDIRLNNKSQLAGFTKKDDLKYFLKEICNTEYVHYDFLAPTKTLLNNFKKGIITWEEYKNEYTKLLKERDIIKKIDVNILNNSCLLCSEASPEFCHRRLLSEYFAQEFEGLEIIHL